MSVYRVKKEKDYVAIQKVALRDKELSWKAKGIHTYMLSLPDDWTFHIEEIATHAKDGVDSLRAGLKELKEKGYLQRYPVKENGKIVRWETHVFETPQIPEVEKPLMEKPHVENPEVEKPQMESPHEANPMLLNNDLELSNELTKKDRLIDSEIQAHAQEQLPSKPESKGDGMPITVSGAVQEEISPANWFGIVEERYLQRRGSGVCISARDGQQITSIIREGIPLETILTGIDRAFETKEKSKEYDGDTIRSFAYCAKVIRQLHHEQNIRARAAADLQGYTPVQPKQPIPNDLVAPNNQEVDAELEELLAQMEEGDE
ncbi:helix-turn-helix domain-containing protein (plasmid) [Aneurinibacillus thermoaerophilus]|uniref:Helix-turn-helix domain-containing protein n=1 Tax=Aneurinibacillus thermoaerophilus TaxID=143495 RepID=A0ABX8YG02_ANETH|nr:helix-turn-helix domain-containing protein [Aneurinibacillus thermoaerophilus]QYY44738.1 helix-turn-helix domain-containing protein [Aneurinibacillus thermoaerophilus]